nr:hypothetical protein [Lusitaniella coriacea]
MSYFSFISPYPRSRGAKGLTVTLLFILALSVFFCARSRALLLQLSSYTKIILLSTPIVTLSTFPKLSALPASLPLDSAIRIELVEGIPIFRASDAVQSRIEVLLNKQQETALSEEEERELDCYEEVDDYLSFVNRTVRNLIVAQN